MTISVQLPGDVEIRLQNLASITGRSKTFYVTQAILEHMDYLENQYLAEHELEAIYAEAPSLDRHELSGFKKRYDVDGTIYLSRQETC